jgi:hypothetical protein
MSYDDPPWIDQNQNNRLEKIVKAHLSRPAPSLERAEWDVRGTKSK